MLAILVGQLGLDLGPEYSERQETVLTAIRLPRVLATALVGAAWAAAGVAMQGLYRTPLADPALVGIGGGAALGATLGTAAAVSLGIVAGYGGTLLVVAAAFVAALVAAWRRVPRGRVLGPCGGGHDAAGRHRALRPSSAP